MDIHHIEHNKHMLVFQKGESVIAELTQHAKNQGINNATMSGIGAVDYIRCGYYDLHNRTYEFTEYDALYEVVSLTANIIQKDDQPFVHMHAVFTDEENHAFGGHIEEMRVGVTLEVMCEVHTTRLIRRYDEETGLYLITSSDGGRKKVSP